MTSVKVSSKFSDPRRARVAAGVAAVLVLAGLVYLSVVHVSGERTAAQELWRGRLTSMADDCSIAIARWVTASLADAEATASFPATRSVAASAARGKEAADREHLIPVLSGVVSSELFSGGWLLDADGNVLVSGGGTSVPDAEVLQGLAKRIRAGHPVAEMERSRDGRVWTYFGAPVRASGSEGPVLGSILFSSDPESFLFPLLRSEPLRTETGETLIVRADGDQVLFLGPLRHRAAAPLTFRVPRSMPRLAAVSAIEGRELFGEFTDYRGKPVFAATRHVPQTAWGVVVKVDREELLRPFGHAIRDQLVILAALVLGLGGVAYGLWRGSRASYETRIAGSQARFAMLLDRASDPIFFIGSDLRIRNANRRAEEFYGYGPGGLVGLHAVDDLRPLEERAVAAGQIEEFERTGRGIFTTKHLRRDGTKVPVEVSVSRFEHEIDDSRVVIVRDLTGRHAAEQRIEALVRILKMSNQIHELMTRARDRADLLEKACTIAVSTGGLRMAWVGLADRESGTIVPAASAGAVDGYFDELEVRADLTPLGQGPAAAAMREGRTVFVNDTAADATFSARGPALDRGYAARAVSPIRGDGEVIGVLGLYSGVAGHFDSEMIGVVEELANDLGFALRSIADRKSLIESELRFRRLAENLPDVIYRRRLLPSPAYEYVSPAVSRLIGYTPSDFYSNPFIMQELMEPGGFERLNDPLVVPWGEATVMPVKHRDGGTIQVEYRRQPVYGEEGELVAVEGIARDVTERHAALEELRRTSATLAALIEASPLAIFTVDEEGLVGLWNAATERLFGWTASEVRGKPLPTYSDERRAQLVDLKDRVLGGEEFAGLELSGRHCKDGSLVDISLSAARIEQAAGRRAVLCIAENITARRVRDDELRKLSRAVEQSPVSIVITNVRGDIDYVNPKFTEITGYAREEVLGKNPRVLKSGESPPELYRALWEAITSGREWRGELHNRKKNGELFWEDASISPIMDDHGRITYFLAVKEDITARKLLEAQFQQSQKMEAIGRLAGGVAHDFNNLLTVISGYTSLLLRDAARDSRPGMALTEIEAASKRAAALTQQLLAFGRRQVLQPRPLSLATVVADLEKMLRRVIGEDVVLSTSSAADLGTVVADPGQIEQILLNLTVNARDAMPGGGRIEIETANATVDEKAVRSMPGMAPGDYVLLSVSDTGTGIPPEVIGHIFEPFFTTKEKGKGTGLGLATVYGIVKQSGGGIYADTELGRGTTFRIYLPRVREAATSPDAAPAEPTVPRGTETILLVEDEDGVRNVVGRLLEDFGYHVIPLSDPMEAIARMGDAGADRVELVLTDIVMPHMDGRTLAGRLRESRPSLKVLFMTGYTPDESLRSGAAEGTAVLQKPFRPEQLARKVREVLDSRPAA